MSSEYSTLFTGTSTGSVRIYEWPFTDSLIFSKMFVDYKLHSSAVTCLKISTDFRYLISSSEDGSVLVTKLKHYSNGFMTSENELHHIFNNSVKDNLIAQFAALIVDSGN